jgi:hypothetical protein
MPTARHSHHRHSRKPSGFSTRLSAFLTLLVDVAVGRHRSRRSRRSPPQHGSTARAVARPWLVKKNVGRLHMLFIACVSMALAWVAWRVVVETAAQNLAGSAPGTAVRLQPDEASALDQLAQQQLMDPNGDLDAAKALAARALLRNPLDDRALVMLGFIAEKKGDHQTADAIAKAAGTRSWRNPVTQLWLFERDVRRGEFASALTHADAMMRVSYDYRQLLLPSLAGFTTDDRTIGPLADMLATNPPWRSGFLQSLSGSLANRARLDKLFELLAHSKSPPSDAELTAYLKRLVRDGEYAKAHEVWLGTLPADERSESALLYNADFRAPIDGTPFNWELASTPGADVQLVTLQGAKSKVLRLQFSGARITPFTAAQLMLLAPGDYRLTGQVKTTKLNTQRGLWWRIVCQGKPATELAHSDLVSGSMPWTDFTVDFTVPAEACSAQRLELQLPARIAPETRIEGEAFYRGLRIAPAAPGPAASH